VFSFNSNQFQLGRNDREWEINLIDGILGEFGREVFVIIFAVGVE
jgi:hypothetical protein